MDNKSMLQAKEGIRPDGSTRQAVLLLLKTKGPSSVGDLARELGITEMAVRRHLTSLERDDSIRSNIVRQPMGRPAHIFSLTEVGENLFPKNYVSLTLDFLEDLEDDPDMGGTVSRLFESRKQKLFQRYLPYMEGKPLEERVEELAKIQNAGGYMVEVDTSCKDEYVMHEYNCPIGLVANRYEQACNCELVLFKELLRAPVERTECLAKGGGKCTYRISKNAD